MAEAARATARTRKTGPTQLNALAEGPRAACELIRANLAWGALLRNARPGDGHPVLVLPGFMGGDGSTLLLRRFLTRLGYVALPWLQGTNTGRPELLDGATRRLFRAHQSMGSQISLVGQSLGGVYAREIARSFPMAVRCVVTLGSPFGASSEESTNSAVARLFETVSGMSVEEMRAQVPQVDPRTPLGLPSTAIYSRLDGVVDWQSCLEQETPLTENIEVVGSHSGMAMNADVLHVVADRLLQDPQRWQKFNRKAGLRSWTYPPAATPQAFPQTA